MSEVVAHRPSRSSKPLTRSPGSKFIFKWASRLLRFFTHPVVVFVLLQLVCVAMTVLWVVWFVNQNEALMEFNRSLGASSVDQSFALGLLIAGCILLGVLIVGVVVLFVIAQKQVRFNRQQQNFVSSVTHELRSPLASLQLAFETMRARTLAPYIQEQLYRGISRDLGRLKKLVDQILLSAKLDRGMIDLTTLRRFQLRELIDEVIEQVKGTDGEIEQRVRIHCGEDIEVLASHDGLVLALVNLLENACKYSEKGTAIVIDAYQDADCVDISIADHGFGLTPREAKKIFKMFHRAHAASIRAIPGTGLGLYIVQTVVKAMGGRVWAESRGRGYGSTFFISLPVRKETAT